MKAAYYSEFGGMINIVDLPDPTPTPCGVVIRVEATGICRSDWHGWMGHDPDITLPHVPGHELAGVVEETGSEIRLWKRGDRVTLPFVCACGACDQCDSGNQQVCDHQFQPGFTHWGSFAGYVAIDYADANLVRLPDEMEFVAAASLGCRFSTAFRAVVDQGRTSRGQWVSVHGCGGVGLSAVMIASAMGANVVAVDISPEQLELASRLGAVATINASEANDIAAEVVELSAGGTHVSIDALGHPDTCYNSITGLRKRGKHVQVGLLSPGQSNARIPVHLVVARELEILGSHGMQAHRYPEMFELINSSRLSLHLLIGETITLEESPEKLLNMDRHDHTGVVIIDRF